MPDIADLRNEKKADISALIEGAVRDMIGASTGKAGEANFARECPRTVLRRGRAMPFRAATRKMYERGGRVKLDARAAAGVGCRP